MTIRKPCTTSSTWGPCKYEEGHAGPHCAEIVSNIADLTSRRVKNAAAFRAAYEVEAACAREVQEATERLHRAQAESVRLRDLEEELRCRLREAETARERALDRGDKLREYVAHVDIAVQEAEGGGNDDVGTLESVKRIVRERDVAREQLAAYRLAVKELLGALDECCVEGDLSEMERLHTAKSALERLWDGL